MASLNQIATSIINELNQPNNFELLERIKDRIKFLGATILRRNIDKYGFGDELIIPLRFKLKEISIPSICENTYNSTCKISETINPIPTLVRTNYKPLFNYIGALDGLYPYYFTKEFNIPILKLQPIFANTVFATLHNNKIRIYNNTLIDIIEVHAVVIDKDNYIDECNNTTLCYSDDNEYILPYDIIDSIITTLITEFANFNNTISDQKVDVDSADKLTQR